MPQLPTASERLLEALGRRIFLAPWTYPNPYYRTSNSAKPKELCDLLIVFGNTVLAFSDKHIALNGKYDPFDAEASILAWNRFQKRGISDSDKQLSGALRTLLDPQSAIYTDQSCSTVISLGKIDSLSVQLLATFSGHEELVSDPDDIIQGQIGLYTGEVLTNAPSGKKGWALLESPRSDGRMFHHIPLFALAHIAAHVDSYPEFIEYLEARKELLSRNNLLVMGEQAILESFLSDTPKDSQARGHRRFLELHRGSESTVAILAHSEGSFLIAPEIRSRAEANSPTYILDEFLHDFWESATLNSHSRAELTECVGPIAELKRAERRTLANAMVSAFSEPAKPEFFCQRRILYHLLDKDTSFIVTRFNISNTHHDRILDELKLQAYCAFVRFPLLSQIITLVRLEHHHLGIQHQMFTIKRKNCEPAILQDLETISSGPEAGSLYFSGEMEVTKEFDYPDGLP